MTSALVGMVTALIGVLTLFRDFGLSSVAVQRMTDTEEQISTLLWINLLLGTALGLSALAMAPSIAALLRRASALRDDAAGFVFNAAGTQHWALLQGEMRFCTLAVISVVSLLMGTAIAIVGAKRGMAIGRSSLCSVLRLSRRSDSGSPRATGGQKSLYLDLVPN